nr:hypothetical protein [Pseudomonas alcaligenes]
MDMEYPQYLPIITRHTVRYNARIALYGYFTHAENTPCFTQPRKVRNTVNGIYYSRHKIQGCFWIVFGNPANRLIQI